MPPKKTKMSNNNAIWELPNALMADLEHVVSSLFSIECDEATHHEKHWTGVTKSNISHAIVRFFGAKANKRREAAYLIKVSSFTEASSNLDHVALLKGQCHCHTEFACSIVHGFLCIGAGRDYHYSFIILIY